MKKSFLAFFIAFSLVLSPLCFAHPPFFIMGSGEIALKNDKTGKFVKVRYREGENRYSEEALKKIHQVYGAPYAIPTERMSLRFLEILSHIQKKFGGATIHILSGYRSARLNQALRDRGKLAATSSMHLESAAADIRLEGVLVTDVRDYAQSLSCCGVGYYHSRHIHLDTGPKRWWDEKTSGTEKKEPQENEKIIALTEKDIYSSKEAIRFDFARISDYPFSVESKLQLEKLEGGEWKKTKTVSMKLLGSVQCLVLDERRQAKKIPLEEVSFSPGRYRIQIRFCDKQWMKMPGAITTNEFEIR